MEIKIPTHIKDLMEVFLKHHYEIYVVGGAVRDSLLGRTPKEYDFTTSAIPSEMIELFQNTSFSVDDHQAALGSIKLYLDNECYEITTFRKESGVINTRYPKKIKFVKSLKIDVKRRDFTINQLAADISGNVIDHENGLIDLNNHVIRMIGDPAKRFVEDPVRILRALRFSNELSFDIDQETYLQMVENARLINYLKDIKYHELFKIIENSNHEYIKKHLNIFIRGFIEFGKWEHLEQCDLKYFKYLYLLDSKIDFANLLTKEEMKIIKELIILNNYDFDNLDNIGLKRLCGMYDNILDYLKIVSIIHQKDYHNLYIQAKDIIDKNIPCSISDLAIKASDLMEIGIPKNQLYHYMKHLLDIVLIDDTKNTKEQLLKELK